MDAAVDCHNRGMNRRTVSIVIGILLAATYAWQLFETASADGSFKPGARYCLEIAGFPRAGAVRAEDGDVLEQGLVRWFDVVGADQAPSPLLHSPSSPFGLAAWPATHARLP